TISWSAMNDGILVAVPLFVLMGEILLRSGVAARMYGAMAGWLSWLPGGLMHANIGTSMLFAATSGSSVATAATVGTTAIPEIKRHGYNEPLFLGSIAASGTLGILIPPSINLIIYGALTNASIPSLYLAGFIPGIGLALMFSLTVWIICRLRPDMAGDSIHVSWAERRNGLPHLIPPIAIFFLVVGSIYAGWATPTEAAALGVLGALGIAALSRSLTRAMLHAAFSGTMRTTGMLLAIVMAAYFLNYIFGSVGLTTNVVRFFEGLTWGPVWTLITIIVFYLLLGLFMETLSLMVATVPIFAPIVVSLGYDPVWFGILVILLIETAMITPPVGINLFVVQGVRGPGGPLSDVVRGVLPFLATLLMAVVLVVLFPQIVLFLPEWLG
ncbi:MAG: TRAP transporter large permease, partial [Rhodobacterales bacterium]